MDADLRREITRRVSDRKRDLDDARARRAHIEALADVFDVERAEVEAIAAEVVAERHAGGTQPGTAARGSPVTAARGSPATAARRSNVSWFVGAALVLVAGLTVAGWFATFGFSQHPGLGGSAPYLKTSIVAGIMSSLTPVKMMVTEHYLANGEYPAGFQELGLRRERLRTADEVDDIALGPQGEIIVRASRTLGSNAYVVLYPEPRMDGLQLKWQCLSSVQVLSSVPCKYADVSDFAARL